MNVTRRAWYEANKERILAERKIRYVKERETVLARWAARRRGPEGDALRAHDRLWAAAHREKCRANTAAWYTKSRPRIREEYKVAARQLRAELLFAYGNRCSCCGIDTEAFLTLDHINRDGKQHRAQARAQFGVYADLKMRGWPKDGYRLLCMNCNWATRFGNACPHVLEGMETSTTTAEARCAEAGYP